jgi:hypothetical protein
MKLPLIFFMEKKDFIASELGSAEPHGPHYPPGRARGGWRALVPSGQLGPPSSGSWFQYFFLFQNNSPKSFVPFRELLFLHKNNTMVVLLKTASVRVSFIQIMQIRVQNKSKFIWKSRYNGDISTSPSLNPCLSSSNSVDKLKVKKKNFYELFFSCLHK